MPSDNGDARWRGEQPSGMPPLEAASSTDLTEDQFRLLILSLHLYEICRDRVIATERTPETFQALSSRRSGQTAFCIAFLLDVTGVKWGDDKIKYNVARFYRNRQGYQAHVDAVLPLCALLSSSPTPPATGFPSFLPYRVHPRGTAPPCVLVAGQRVSDLWFRLDALSSTKVQLSLCCSWQVLVKKVQYLFASAGDTTSFQFASAHRPGGLVPFDSGRTGDSVIVKWIITQSITSALMDPDCLVHDVQFAIPLGKTVVLSNRMFNVCNPWYRPFTHVTLRVTTADLSRCLNRGCEG